MEKHIRFVRQASKEFLCAGTVTAFAPLFDQSGYVEERV